MLFYLLALTGLVTVTVTYGVAGRVSKAVAILALSAVCFGAAGLADQANAAPLPTHHTRNTESTFGCTAGAIGVGLAWIGTGVTAVTAEAHAGILTALAAGQSSAATAGWAASCPKMAKSLLGMKPWVWTHSGCFKIHITRMNGMPLSFCWKNIGSFRQWVDVMNAKTRAIAVAMYKGDL